MSPYKQHSLFSLIIKIREQIKSFIRGIAHATELTQRGIRQRQKFPVNQKDTGTITKLNIASFQEIISRTTKYIPAEKTL